jgi:Ca2+-binding EF-hand superfamily protein
MLNPQEVQQLQQQFNAIDKDRSGQICPSELAAVPFDGIKFSIETTLLLVRVFDKDKSGTVGFNEFGALAKFISSMKQAFQAYDRDRSGSIELNEVQMAVSQGGFQLSPQTLQAVYNKFLRNPVLNAGGKLKGLNLEMFVQLCAFLGSTRSQFMQYDFQRSGWIQVNLDMFVTMSI